MQLSSGLSSKFYSYQQATPSNSPLHRGRVDCQAVHPQPPGKRGQTKSLLGICRTKGGSRPFRAQYPEGERELIGRELLYNFPYFVFYNLKFTFVLCYL